MPKAVIVSALKCKQPIDYSPGDLLIACDKGFDRVKEAGLVPDVVIGDFDSLGFTPDFENIIKLPVKKDDTDTGYAINYAIEKGFNKIAVYGALGGMLDHTFASFQLAAGASKKGVDIRFFGDDCILLAVTNGKIALKSGNNRFSVFAVDSCSGVTIKNAEFEIADSTLSPFFPLGVSNRKNGETVIEVKSGTLIVIECL